MTTDIKLYKKVEETVLRRDMLREGERVVAGVSGGPDSVFLLYAIVHLRKRLGLEVFVANVDHGLRGRASRTDSEFTRGLAEKLGLICIHTRIEHKKGGAGKRLSVEEYFRERRYNFFVSACQELRADAIATGHTLDDQAETVMMRILKGSTVKGLSGVAPVGRRAGLKVVRPLIEMEKEEIVCFLTESGIPYRVDRTNRDEKYLRNAVRLSVMPFLSGYNPKLKRSLARMADSLREDRAFIESEKRKKALLKKDGSCCVIELKDIVVQPSALRREILRDAIISSGASVKKLTYRHWKEMDHFLRHKRKGQSMDLPGGVTLRREKTAIRFYLKQ